MKLNLTYLEAEHDEVPGVHRWLVAPGDNATEKAHREWATTAGGKISHSQTLPVELPDAWSTLEMEAALCVWEWINEVTLDDGKPDWIEYRDGVGSVELRHESMKIGQWVLKVYDLLPKWVRESGSYDWEIVPAICSELTPGEAYPTPKVAALNVINSDWAKAEYHRTAQAYHERHYGISFGMTPEEFLDRWYDPDATPEEAARHCALKYNLEEIRR